METLEVICGATDEDFMQCGRQEQEGPEHGFFFLAVTMGNLPLCAFIF